MPALFDAYVIVDWSANSKPKTGADSIWIGGSTRIDGQRCDSTPLNPSTRAQAKSWVEAILTEHVQAGRRVLVGFDFPYGYPAGFAAMAFGSPAGNDRWRRTWDALIELVRDDPDNRNNRFEVAATLNKACGLRGGPFWGCPAAAAGDCLSTKGHTWEAGLRRLRHTEAALLRRGLQVQEAWKLWTAGSVGSQALLGIPVVAALREAAALRDVSQVWPFETGFPLELPADGTPAIVHAEIWPGIVRIDPGHEVKDAVQVRSLAAHFSDLDGRGELRHLFAAPDHLLPVAFVDVVNEEGWILGA